MSNTEYAKQKVDPNQYDFPIWNERGTPLYLAKIINEKVTNGEYTDDLKAYLGNLKHAYENTLLDWLGQDPDELETKKDELEDQLNDLKDDLNLKSYTDLNALKTEISNLETEISNLEESIENSTGTEWFNIEYRIDSSGEYKSVQLMVAAGGPNCYIDTEDQKFHLYSWGDHYSTPLSQEVCDGLDEYFEEYYQMTIGHINL